MTSHIAVAYRRCFCAHTFAVRMMFRLFALLVELRFSRIHPESSLSSNAAVINKISSFEVRHLESPEVTMYLDAQVKMLLIALFGGWLASCGIKRILVAGKQAPSVLDPLIALLLILATFSHCNCKRFTSRTRI